MVNGEGDAIVFHEGMKTCPALCRLCGDLSPSSVMLRDGVCLKCCFDGSADELDEL
jgi:hypothetical protein